MDFEEYLQMMQGEGDVAQPLLYQPVLTQGLMGGANQQNIQNMLNTTQQGIQQGMAASQNLQSQRDAQADATQQQAMQAYQQREAEKRKAQAGLLNLGLTLATGGFGGAAGAGFGGGMSAGINGALSGTPLGATTFF